MIRRLLALSLAAASVPVALAATAAPAHADIVPVEDVTFSWGISGYAQVGAAFGPWTYPRLSGEATVLAGSVSGGSQTEYAALPGQTSMPASSPQKTPNAVKLLGGTGTADPATGEIDVTWTGSYVVNAYPKTYNAPDEVYADPHLDIDAAGVGTLSFVVTIGAGKDINGNPSPAVSLGRVTVLTFASGSDSALGTDGFRYTPTFAGTEVTDTEPQNRNCTGWGSWPASFVNAVPDSIAPHFYTTGGATGTCAGLQAAKPPLPVQVDLGLSGQTATTTAISAPRRAYGQTSTVSVAVTGATSGPVAVLSGGTVLARGTLTNGRATFSFGKPAAGSYPLTARYYGTETGSPSTSSATTLVITKAATTSALSFVKKPSRTKAGSVKVKVASPTASPAGRVTVRVKKGAKTVKTLTGTLRSGTATVVVPKLGKGTYTLAATYAGDRNVATSTSRNTALTVK